MLKVDWSKSVLIPFVDWGPRFVLDRPAFRLGMPLLSATPTDLITFSQSFAPFWVVSPTTFTLTLDDFLEGVQGLSPLVVVASIVTR